MSKTLLIIQCLVNIIGLGGWVFLSMLLMEVTICKDARSVDTTRILNRNFAARLRLFKRSFKNTFYRASVCLFIGAFLGVSIMLNEMYFGPVTGKHYLWSTFSLIVPWALVVLYQYFGYQWTFYVKFKLYLQNKLD